MLKTTNQSGKAILGLFLAGVVLWVFLSWIIAGQILILRTQGIVRNELAELGRQADFLAENVKLATVRLQAYAQLLAVENDIQNVLAYPPAVPGGEKYTVERRKHRWSINPQLAKINKRLASENSILGTGVMYIMDANGDCVLSSNAAKRDSFIGANFSSRQYFNMARAGKYGYQYAVGKVSNVPGVYFSAPVVAGSRNIGVAAVKVNIDALSVLATQTDSFISDQFGVIILARENNLLMKALPGRGLAKLDKEERLARYKRAEFVPFDTEVWPVIDLPDLKYIAGENEPFLVAERRIEEINVAVHVVKHLPSVATFNRDRLVLFLLLALLGTVIIVGIRQRNSLLKNRKEFQDSERIALERLQMRDKALEQISQGVLIADANRMTTYVNSGFVKITGYTLDDMLGRSCSILQGYLTNEDMKNRIRTALAENKPFHGEILNYRKDGAIFWNELSIDPVFNSLGKVTQYVSVQRDVTESVFTRKNLQRKEFALNAAANALVIMDMNGHVEWVNHAYNRMTGYETLEVIGDTLEELHNAYGHHGTLLEEVWGAIKNKTSWKGDVLCKRKDGSSYIEEIFITPLIDETGETVNLFAVKQDITQRKALERDLRESKDDLYRMLNFMEEGAFEINVLGICKFVNRACLKYLGYQNESELLGKPIHALIQHSYADGSPFFVEDSKLLLVIYTHQLSTASDQVFWRKDGTCIPVEFWSHAIEMDGVVVGAIVTFVDISRRVFVEQERQNLLSQLIEKNRLLMNYSERVKEEEKVARDFLNQFCALDKINDPLVQFTLKPAESFSGDLIAFARTPDDRLHVLLADSAGHGLTAALAVIPLTQPFYQMTAKGFDLPAIAKEINRRVMAYLQLPRYVACVLVSLDIQNQVIQVWNGGCPDLLLLDADGRDILHHFVSSHLPMGVVNPEAFTATVEHYSYEGRRCKLLVCSDGATELCDEDGKMIGYGGLLKRVQQSHSTGVFNRLVDAVEAELDGKAPQDDIAMVVITCAGTKEIRAAPNGETAADSDLRNSFLDINFSGQCVSEWFYRMTLTQHQLKRLDVVPFLLDITSQLDGERANGKVFLVLSEMFNNALDHGILKLDSSIKNKSEDMGLYYTLRAERLANLEYGKIEMGIEKFKSASGYVMKIHCKDSGGGFDFSTLNNLKLAKTNKKRYGRGIPLLKGACNALQYLGNGSEVIAYLELS